jgi:hypothetical protein
MAGRNVYRALVAILALTCTACFSPITARPAITKVGEVRNEQGAPPAASHGPVRVFIGNAPPGFSGGGSELKVEAGYSHHIVGLVKVYLDFGTCDVKPHITREIVLEALKSKAQAAGANAVVFVDPSLPATDEMPDPCDRIRTLLSLETAIAGSAVVAATGWAVVLGTNSTTP